MVKRVEEMQGTDATKPTTAVYDSFVGAQVKAEQRCIVAPTLKIAEFEQGRSGPFVISNAGSQVGKREG
ncbi:hypothetical protein R1flu_004975 [Riccia fluitans]|uniref:Uncharacterized protein n=1 Tax=Riccia fluitans TaxID=41844 RepID=A0ABD1YRU3_9MARC